MLLLLFWQDGRFLLQLHQLCFIFSGFRLLGLLLEIHCLQLLLFLTLQLFFIEFNSRFSDFSIAIQSPIINNAASVQKALIEIVVIGIFDVGKLRNSLPVRSLLSLHNHYKLQKPISILRRSITIASKRFIPFEQFIELYLSVHLGRSGRIIGVNSIDHLEEDHA